MSLLCHLIAASSLWGWCVGTWVSFDNGQAWTGLGYTGHLHADVHALTFDPGNFRTLYIGSDGGMASVSDLAQGVTPTLRSSYNQHLLDLELYHVSASSVANGLVAGALQDNADNYVQVDPSSTFPWIYATGGGADGVGVEFITPSQLPPQHDILVRAEGNGTISWPWTRADWTGMQSINTAETHIPLPQDPNGLTPGPFAKVQIPRHRNGSGELMYAVGAAGSDNQIDGLFAKETGVFCLLVGGCLHWEPLGEVGTGEVVTALSSRLGDDVMIGTDKGNIYVLLDPSGGEMQQLPLTAPEKGGGRIGAIIELESVVFAAWNGQNGHILRWRDWQWKDVGPSGDIGFAAFDSPGNGSSVFAVTQNRVYESIDLGDSWLAASDGLPAVPQGMDIHSVKEPSGKTFLYLATYGRSLWRAELKP